MTDGRIYDEKELQKLLPVPVISEIPALTAVADEHKGGAPAIVAGLGDGGIGLGCDPAGIGPQLFARLTIFIIHHSSCIKPSST